MAWRIEFHPDATRDLSRLDRQVQKRIIRFLYDRLLAVPDPRKLGAPLSGTLKGLWKYRIGDWRVVARIRNELVMIYIVRVGHRREIYD